MGRIKKSDTQKPSKFKKEMSTSQVSKKLWQLLNLGDAEYDQMEEYECQRKTMKS